MADQQADQTDFGWELALAVNAAFKGLLASSGQSGHICARVSPISTDLDVSAGWEAVQYQIATSLPSETQSGDVVVVADKIVAAALGRIGPREIIKKPDPKTISPNHLQELAEYWTSILKFPVEWYHLLLADEYLSTSATLGTDAPNKRSAELAQTIKHRRSLTVDVIISDTDTGLDVRRPLIGIITIAATPLGATAGVNLYEAMRCAVAAEFTRGHTLGIPVVVCVPSERRRPRPQTGEPRAYPGLLDASKEDRIAHA